MTAASAENLLSLGPEVCCARPLSGLESTRRAGFAFPWMFYYLVPTLFAIPFFTVWIAGGAMGLFRAIFANASPAMIRLVLLLVASATYALFAYYIYVFPSRDRVILYEHGLFIRMGFKRRRIPFQLIQTLATGRSLPAWERKLRSINRVFHPDIARLGDHLATTALSITLADGRQHVFKVFLTRFDSDDMAHLFEELLRRNPHLGAKDSAAPPD